MTSDYCIHVEYCTLYGFTLLCIFSLLIQYYLTHTACACTFDMCMHMDMHMLWTGVGTRRPSFAGRVALVTAHVTYMNSH